MTQSVIVACIVAAAVACSAWMLMPASWRRAGAAWLARRAGRCGVGREHALALQMRLERAGACSDCGSCKGCASAPPAASQGARWLPRVQERSTGP